MPTEIKVNVAEAVRKLRRVTNILDPEAILGAIGQRQLFWINQNLREGGTETRWPPMSPNTVAARPQRPSNRQFSSRYQSQLQQSFVSKVRAPRVDVGTELQYADIHHHGTGPYTIVPRQARFLRFQTAQGVAYAKRVNHPGIPARPLIMSARVGKDLATAVIEGIVRDLSAEERR